MTAIPGYVRPRATRAAGFLSCACALFAVLAAADRASAQTVLLRGLAQGTAVEVALNGTLVGSATANSSGDATVPLGQAAGTKPQMDANIYVDVCGERRRVVVFDRSQNDILPEGDCGRIEVPGVYVVRSISTLVVNTASATPTMMLVQGPYDPNAPPKTWQPLPTGLMVFGGTGLSFISNAGLYACGTVSDCNEDGSGFGFIGGAQYWLASWLGAEVAFIKPASMSADGSGTGYTFDSSLETSMLTITGNVGVPAGPMRFYAKAGANYHKGLFTNNEDIEDTVILLDETTGETVTYAGGTNTIDYQTAGWGWYFGGGAEAWFKTRYAIFAEIGWAGLKGANQGEGEGEMSDKVTTIFVGGRIRVF